MVVEKVEQQVVEELRIRQHALDEEQSKELTEVMKVHALQSGGDNIR
jgi:hypothetical protein